MTIVFERAEAPAARVNPSGEAGLQVKYLKMSRFCIATGQAWNVNLARGVELLVEFDLFSRKSNVSRRVSFSQ